MKRQPLSCLSLAFSAALLFFSACSHGPGHEHGHVEFPVSCSDEANREFESGLVQLHHMMYEQARPHFQAVIDADPECAMGYWGIAMTSFYPLWMPTPDEQLERGRSAVALARSTGEVTEREEGYISATEAFFRDPEPPAAGRAADHAARLESWYMAQRSLHEAYPEDVDATALYALSKVAYAMSLFSPGEERDYTLQREAGALLERYFEDHPYHPGLFHYLIHAYDSPELAHHAEEVARAYDRLAPDTPHALHMPSHIFVRMGNWEETIEWNIRSAEAALRQAETDSHAKLHYVHALDYMMYGYLQQGEEESAAETLEKVRNVEQVPLDFVSAYGLAAAQARYYLEQYKWEEAADLQAGVPDILDWERVPAATALFHYARGIGAARSGDTRKAEQELAKIDDAVARLRESGDHYWAGMTDALSMAVEAWMRYERGNREYALSLLADAADLEESMDKHPVTPGEIFPVRELYAEMLLLEGQVSEAADAFERSLERTPNRRNALLGIEQAQAMVTLP